MNSKEKRSHVRGDFAFEVKFRAITLEEYKKLRGAGNQVLFMDKKQSLIDSTFSDNRENDITRNDQLIDFLVHMDEKLDQILTMLSYDGAAREFTYQGIGENISISGMNITVDKPFELGEIIHSNFVLSRFPLTVIDLFGEVVRVSPVDKNGETIYQLGIKFLDVNPDDREKIIARVFQKQREAIRRRKSEADHSKDS